MSEKFNQNDDSIGPDSISPDSIIEAIDACRPGSNDVADPSLAFIADHADFIDLRSRIEQIDAKIKKAFADVPVPAGLEARILAALADAPLADKTATVDKPIPLDVIAKPRRRYRHWYLGASAAFVAASLLLALVLEWTAAVPLDELSVVQVAMDDFDSPVIGRPLSQVLPQAVKDYQPSLDLNLSLCKSIRWQSLDKFLDTKGIVYTFITPQGSQARLYVLESPAGVGDLPDSPPRTPPGNTLGLRAATWQSGDRLYILVVRGDIHAYRGLFAPAVPLT